jgi:quinol monooxygenase YgiN
MSETVVVLSVVFEAAPGRADELAGMLKKLIAPTRAEPGCLTYELNASTETPGTFLFFEKFVNQAALDEHIAAPYFQEFAKQREGNDPVSKVTVMRWSVLA